MVVTERFQGCRVLVRRNGSGVVQPTRSSNRVRVLKLSKHFVLVTDANLQVGNL